jgi:hypothetical protein
MGKMVAKVGALLLCGSIAAVLAPGCTIRIGPGTGEDGPSNSSGGTAEPDSTGTTNSETLSPEEQAAIEALQNADPNDVKVGTAMAAYAAVGTASLVEAQTLDPNTVDDATLQQLYNEYAPIAVDEAISWMQSVDPSTIPTATWNTINFTCEEEPYTCPRKDYCSFGGEPVLCVINECGTGPCSNCPWPLKNLVFKSWCLYGCGRGDKYLGAAFRLITRFPLKLGEFTCVPFGKL